MVDRTEYWVGARSYLERAKARLDEEKHESIFYAAYELRCAVEARQDDYLQAQQAYAVSLPKAWRIGEQGKVLDGIFRSDQIQSLTFRQDDHPDFTVYHVPVDQALRDKVQGLNDLMHAQGRYRKHYNRWWIQARERVVDVYRRTWIACQGALLSPVFNEGSNGQLQGHAQMELNSPEAETFAKTMRTGKRFMVYVQYLNAPPAQWVPDL